MCMHVCVRAKVSNIFMTKLGITTISLLISAMPEGVRQVLLQEAKDSKVFATITHYDDII